MTRYRMKIAAALALALLIQTPGLAAQDTAAPPPPAARIDPATGGLAANTTTLEIKFVQIANPTGQIMLALFDSKEAYDSGAAPVRAIAIPVTGTAATATIPNVLHGRYGFKIIHDVNGDGAMNTNPLGDADRALCLLQQCGGQYGPGDMGGRRFRHCRPDLANHHLSLNHRKKEPGP
ncbi:MAG: DUF2141 domain-containing protein [Porphyrobacter sp.]|jgi:uncharacterized protein (DUF2141 family)|nr:DUF2141 domain-containing protein [Porphyrobacter sp.]